MTKNTLPRHVQLERAAKTRAILVAFMNKQTTPISIKDTVSSISKELTLIGIDGTSVPYQLQQLAENKLIGVDKIGNHMMYFGTSANTPTVTDTSTPKKHKVKFEDVVPVQISVDFVKSTGKVRFLLNGVVIEIGVVQ